MPIIAMLLEFAVQVLFAMHAYRTGRGQYWIYIILIFPMMGSLLYFLLEVAPEVVRGPAGQHARSRWRKAMDPEKEYRDAKYAFDTTPTVNNRIRFAQVLNARRDYDAVIALLEPALTNHFAEDAMLLEGLAYAYYDKGDYRKALEYIQKLFDREDTTPQNYIRLLRCRALIQLGEMEKARDELTRLTVFFTGEEARIALAQLHEKMGNMAAAQAVYQDIVTRSKHAPEHYRKHEREWIDVAERALKAG
jgi:hypothetical protein